MQFGSEAVGFADLDRNAVHVQNRLAGQRGDPTARGQDPDQIQWVGCGDQNHLALVTLAPDSAQRLHGLGQRELLPAESVHKAAARISPRASSRQ